MMLYDLNVDVDIKCVAEQINPQRVEQCTLEYNQLKIYFSETEKSMSTCTSKA